MSRDALSSVAQSSLTKHDPKAAALKIHTLEAAERIAARAKNAEALEAAVLEKLEAQRDFAAWYRAQFGQGARSDMTSARSGRSAEEICGQFGFADRTVRRWAERLLDEASFQVERHERLAKVWRILEMAQAANFSSESVEWYTPERYVEAARSVLGAIDLDPASSVTANAVVRATAFLTHADDGLTQDWNGRIFLNPPYGRTSTGESLAGAFCNKAIAEHRAGRVSAGIILVNSVHSQSWQAPLYRLPICLVDHRIEFISADGQKNENPTFQNLFCYLGSDIKAFAKAFGQFGYVMRMIS